MAAQRSELELLRSEVAELRARLDSLDASGGDEVARRHDSSAGHPGATDRRGALRLAAGAAAGAIAATAVSRPAAADDPNDVTLGSVKETGARPTGSRYTGAGSGVGALFASGAGANGTSAEFSAALGAWGHSANQPNGLYGFAEQAGAAGVVGKNETGAGGVGVRAIGRTYGLVAETRNDGSTDNWGVLGVGDDAGVAGEGTVVGVTGTADDVGVRGTATSASGTGVAGTGAFGAWCVGEFIGVRGQGEIFGVQAAGEISDLLLEGLTPVPPDVVGGPQRFAGELTADVNDELWYCVGSGAPGDWRKLAGSATAGALHPVGPYRVYDSRLAAYPISGPMSADQDRVIGVADGRDIDGVVIAPGVVPAGASAVSINLTVTDTGGPNFLSVTPGDAATFDASSINWWQAGSILANGLIVPVSAQRELRVFAGPGGSTHFVVDITGFWR